MHQEDRFSEDVIKIFHNAKGSVKNKIVEWTNHQDVEATSEDQPLKIQWNPTYLQTPFDHAAGEYEPLPVDESSLNKGIKYISKSSMQSVKVFKELSPYVELSSLLQEVEHQMKDTNDHHSELEER